MRSKHIRNPAQRLDRKFLSWHIKPSSGKNLDFLDGLRGIAILGVVACHLFYTSTSSSFIVLFVGGIFQAGSMGVPLFFALSGFLVSIPFWKQKMAGGTALLPAGYARRRFIKIYPPLALMVILFTPIYILFDKDPSYIKPAAEWLVGLPVFFPVDGRFNPVLWTLTVEIQFYITLPLAMWLCRGVAISKAVWLLPFALFTVSVVAYHIFAANGIHGSIYPNVFSPLFSGLDAFVPGVLVGGLFTMGKIKKSVARLGFVGLVMLAVLIPLIAFLAVTGRWTTPIHDLTDLLEQVAFGCLLCFAGDTSNLGARLIANPLLRWFGIVSYEWYLFHQAIFIWIRRAAGQGNGSPLHFLLVVGGSFLVGLLLAVVIYRFYSLPLLMCDKKRNS